MVNRYFQLLEILDAEDDDIVGRLPVPVCTPEGTEECRVGREGASESGH